jgi:ACS family tartrate transporter-like MFS transporter
MDRVIERTTMRKVYLRLLPFAALVYFFCYIDRINVAFAALTMNQALGLSAAAYGLSAGAFYLGYCAFGVPSNVVQDKVGARVWISVIMVAWGLCAGATAFAVGTKSFLLIRFLLGVAEAGMFPGMLLLFAYWIPDRHRARIISGFTLSLPVSVALGAPISTAILGLDGWLGIAGWKLVYLLEALPTVVLGIGTLFYLTDRPAEARWLSAEEKAWLTGRLEAERRAVERAGKLGPVQALVDPKVLLLCLTYLGLNIASLGVLLFVPQIIRSLGTTTMGTGFATTLTYVCGAISMVAWGWVSDRMGERRWNLFWTCMVSTVGLAVAALTMGSMWAMVGLCIAAAGFYGAKGPFWATPSMLLTGSAAAAGIAWINSIGNVGGFFGPAIIGWLKDVTGSYSGGLLGLAAFTLLSAGIVAIGLHIPRRLLPVPDDARSAAS